MTQWLKMNQPEVSKVIDEGPQVKIIKQMMHA